MDTVYTEGMRVLHYIYMSSYYKVNHNKITEMDPQKLADDLVLSFDRFLDNKLDT